MPNAIHTPLGLSRGELFDYIVRHQRLQEGQACFFFRQLVRFTTSQPIVFRRGGRFLGALSGDLIPPATVSTSVLD